MTKENKSYRVEQHNIKAYKELDLISFYSKNLYNFVNYMYRQVFFHNRDSDTKKPIPTAYNIMKDLAKENQVDYRSLPSAVAQKVVKSVEEVWKSYFKILKDFRLHPEKYKGKPALPKYKHKTNGRYKLSFSSNGFSYKKGFIHFPKCTGIKPVRTLVTSESIARVDIVPTRCAFRILVIHKVSEVQHADVDKSKSVGIDLGLNNFITLVDNSGSSRPIIIKGGKIKAMNQWYNKRKAFLQGELPEYRRTSKQINKLSEKRENQIRDFLHKVSNFVINHCVSNRIGNLVVGYSQDWKTEINLGTKTNQNFVQIPFRRFINYLEYKAESVGINFQKQEESYTSKCDALSKEPICKHEHYLGKRKCRGLFVSATGAHINADVNGALNILRKAIGDDNVVVSNWGILSMPLVETISTRTPPL